MNFLFLFCSIPLVTIGPAYVALLACADAFWKEEGASPTETFFRHFRAAFLPSALLGMATLFLLVLLACNTLFAMTVFTGAIRVVLLGVYLLFFLFFLAFVYHAARMIGHFQNFRPRYLKAAFLATAAHLPRGGHRRRHDVPVGFAVFPYGGHFVPAADAPFFLVFHGGDFLCTAVRRLHGRMGGIQWEVMGKRFLARKNISTEYSKRNGIIVQYCKKRRKEIAKF